MLKSIKKSLPLKKICQVLKNQPSEKIVPDDPLLVTNFDFVLTNRLYQIKFYLMLLKLFRISVCSAKFNFGLLCAFFFRNKTKLLSLLPLFLTDIDQKYLNNNHKNNHINLFSFCFRSIICSVKSKRIQSISNISNRILVAKL